MPTALLPVVGETVEVCSNTGGSQNHGQPERKETYAHYECCGSIAGANAAHGQSSIHVRCRVFRAYFVIQPNVYANEV